MTNRIYQWLLMATLTMFFSMSVTSCKEDDKDNSEEQQKEMEEEAAQAEKAFKFYEVVSQLADLSEMTADYESQTFEPFIGDEAEGDPLTRIVSINDMATAAEYFAELTGADVTEDTPSFTYSDPAVGTLIYTRTNDGKSWATVDVNIKQVPALKKIVYQSAEQAGTNGSFRGTAYYRFGDVIQRTYTSKPKAKGMPAQICTEYWICVRPAFGPDEKGDSHWVCLNQLPEDNMEYVDGSNHTDYYVPTKVCTETKHMQNLAELLYAIFHPEEWKQNLDTYHGQGLKMFNGLKYENIDYHNEYFWRRVQQGWRENNIAQLAFNMKSLDDLQHAIDTEGLNLLYKGYKWLKTLSWSCELFTARYSSGEYIDEQNFHLAEFGSKKVDMRDIHFDCHNMGEDIKNYREFFGNDTIRRWVIRYAPGKKLMSRGTFNKFEGITGCEEVWRYNREFGPWDNLSNTPPEKTPMMFTNRGFYAPGDVVKDEKGNRWFCVQGSPYQGVYNPADDYSYFVSFDKGAIGDNLGNLPSKNLAMQIMFSIEIFFHDIFSHIEEDKNGAFASVAHTLIKSYADVDILDLVAVRDTMHAFPVDPNHKEEVPNSFINALYRDENGQLCVLRLIGDYTAFQDEGGQYGVRDWSWHFYDKYREPNGNYERPMFLSDLGDPDLVRTYSKDIWVTLPWYDLNQRKKVASPGYRTTTENVDDLNRFFYVLGHNIYNGNIATNMYNEPIVAFAVKRVRDTGGRASHFDDGTKFTKVNYGLEEYLIKEASIMYKNHNPSVLTSTYNIYEHREYLNDVIYHWGMNNPTR